MFMREKPRLRLFIFLGTGAVLLVTAIIALAVTLTSARKGGYNRADGATFSVAASESVPDHDVSVPLDGSYLSYSIEAAYMDKFFSGETATTPNTFTARLLQHLSDRTGKTPYIRPGGNSQDIAEYSANTQVSIDRIADDQGRVWRTLNGPTFYESWNTNFPSGHKFVVSLNLKNDSLPDTIAAAVAAVKLAGDRIAYFELGNEPNLYNGSAAFPDTATYVNKWLNWTAAIDAAVDRAAPSTLQLPKRRWNVASNTARAISPALDPSDLIGAGIDKNGQVAQYSIHAYSRSRCTPDREKNATVEGLLDMLTLKTYVQTRIQPSVPVLASGAGGSRRWILGEGNSISCGGKMGVSDTLAQALHLTAMSLYWAAAGASQMYLHNGGSLVRRDADGKLTNDTSVPLGTSYAAYSIVYPTDSVSRGQQRAQPGYVSQLLLAEAIGSGGKTRAALLETPKGLDPTTAFLAAIYDETVPGGKGPARLVLLNTTPYLNTTGEPTNFNYDFSSIAKPYGNATFYAKRLTGTFANTQDSAEITYAGQSYKFAEPDGERTIEEITNAKVNLRASEAVLVYIRGQPY